MNGLDVFEAWLGGTEPHARVDSGTALRLAAIDGDDAQVLVDVMDDYVNEFFTLKTEADDYDNELKDTARRYIGALIEIVEAYESERNPLSRDERRMINDAEEF